MMASHNQVMNTAVILNIGGIMVGGGGGFLMAFWLTSYSTRVLGLHETFLVSSGTKQL